MNTRRMVAVGLIFALACAGWWTLGTATLQRSGRFLARLGEAVEALWGAPLIQEAPALAVQIPGSDRERPIAPSRTDVRVDLQTDYRRKGLLWYSTYVCDFQATYSVSNAESVAQKVRLHFKFPYGEGTYDNFSMRVGGKPVESRADTQAGMGEILELSPGESRDFTVTYRTRGIGEWRYRPDPAVGRVQDLKLAVHTNFRRVDYPEGCLSPMSAEATADGRQLTWQATDLITRGDIGVVIPEKLNPGPLTSRITFFAPVCLLFFFVLTATIGLTRSIPIHPMHYLFVAAGFFAFHLLLAYLVGLVDVHVSFALAAATAVTMVTVYLSAALGPRFPWKAAAAGMVFFLVLFSYSFFFEGITGLTVAIGSVVTLGVLMKVTARLDWAAILAPRASEDPGTHRDD